MADSAIITTSVNDGTTIDSNLTNGVSITSSVVEGTSVTSNISAGAKGDKGDTGATGATGAQGPQGETGPAGADGTDGTDGVAATVAVGTTTTGSAGTDASVSNSGTDSAAVLDFTIPRGATGATGAKGDTGTAATIEVGTVTTGAAGTDVTVANSRTTSAAVFDFTIPKGDTGAAGSGSGDMLATTYDPNSVNADAFDYNNFENTPTLATVATSGAYTDLSGAPTIPDSLDDLTGTADDITEGTTHKFLTTAERTKLTNTSGTNTGDQTTITGNAGTATALETARTINGVSFDGSADINTPGIQWVNVTGTSQTASINHGYIAGNASLVTVTLPGTAAIGTVIRVAGAGAGGWKIAQNASQTIHFGDVDTTTGTGGSLTSVNRYDAVELLCVTANTDFVVVSSQGNITVV